MRADRPSRTALKVGLGVAYLAQDPRFLALLPPGLAEWNERLLMATGRLKPWHLELFKKGWYKSFVRGFERRTADGQVLNIGVRKRFMDDESRAAVVAGAEQVLVVGAGFDTLALRLSSEFPEVSFVEIDHPATQKAKRESIEAMGEARPNLHLVPVDLASASLAETLGRLEAWRPERMSVVIAEGLLMYLPEEAVHVFLESVRRTSGAGSRLLFTHMRRGPDGQVWIGGGSGFTRLWFRAFGEALLWGVRDRGELEAMLSRHDFEPFPTERVDLHRRYLEPAGLATFKLGGVEFAAGATLEASSTSAR